MKASEKKNFKEVDLNKVSRALADRAGSLNAIPEGTTGTFLAKAHDVKFSIGTFPMAVFETTDKKEFYHVGFGKARGDYRLNGNALQIEKTLCPEGTSFQSIVGKPLKFTGYIDQEVDIYGAEGTVTQKFPIFEHVV